MHPCKTIALRGAMQMRYLIFCQSAAMVQAAALAAKAGLAYLRNDFLELVGVKEPSCVKDDKI